MEDVLCGLLWCGLVGVVAGVVIGIIRLRDPPGI